MKEIKKAQKPRRKRTDGFTIEFKKLMESSGYRHVTNNGLCLNSQKDLRSPAYEKRLTRNISVWFSYYSLSNNDITINYGIKTDYSSKMNDIAKMPDDINAAIREQQKVFTAIMQLKDKCYENAKTAMCDQELRRAEEEYKAKVEAIKSKYTEQEVQTSLF